MCFFFSLSHFVASSTAFRKRFMVYDTRPMAKSQSRDAHNTFIHLCTYISMTTLEETANSIGLTSNIDSNFSWFSRAIRTLSGIFSFLNCRFIHVHCARTRVDHNVSLVMACMHEWNCIRPGKTGKADVRSRALCCACVREPIS